MEISSLSSRGCAVIEKMYKQVFFKQVFFIQEVSKGKQNSKREIKKYILTKYILIRVANDLISDWINKQ